MKIKVKEIYWLKVYQLNFEFWEGCIFKVDEKNNLRSNFSENPQWYTALGYEKKVVTMSNKKPKANM